MLLSYDLLFSFYTIHLEFPRYNLAFNGNSFLSFIYIYIFPITNVLFFQSFYSGWRSIKRDYPPCSAFSTAIWYPLEKNFSFFLGFFYLFLHGFFFEFMAALHAHNNDKHQSNYHGSCPIWVRKHIQIIRICPVQSCLLN
jgi:hypothetical protein